MLQGNERPSIWVSTWNFAWVLILEIALLQILQHHTPSEFLSIFSCMDCSFIKHLLMCCRSDCTLVSTVMDDHMYSIWAHTVSCTCVFVFLSWPSALHAGWVADWDQIPPIYKIKMPFLWRRIRRPPRNLWAVVRNHTVIILWGLSDHFSIGF